MYVNWVYRCELVICLSRYGRASYVPVYPPFIQVRISDFIDFTYEACPHSTFLASIALSTTPER